MARLTQSLSVTKSLSGLSALITCALLVAGCGGPFSTLDPAGPSATYAAWLWWGMAIFFTLVLAAVVALWLYALRRPPRQWSEQQEQRVLRWCLLGGGLALPLGSIAVILAFGIPLGHRMLPLPPAQGDAVQIEVIGHQWWWQVRYPGTDIELRNRVTIPAGQPVDIQLTSEDVVHSFWVPRLGGKMDMVPGHTNTLRLQADEPGEYRGQCAEFCGTGHAHMQFVVTALSPEDFAQWLEETATHE